MSESGDADRKIEKKKKKKKTVAKFGLQPRSRGEGVGILVFRVEFIRVIRARRRSVGERTNKPWNEGFLAEPNGRTKVHTDGERAAHNYALCVASCTAAKHVRTSAANCV